MSNRRRSRRASARLERLPCGCAIGNATVEGEKSFLIRPCSLTCPHYRYAIDQAKLQGKSIKMR